jgi:hypothetical protein
VKMVKLRLTQDCEHGPKGKILDVEDYRVPAFMVEGRVEAVQDEQAASEALPPAVVVPEPQKPAKPTAKPPKRPRK